MTLAQIYVLVLPLVAFVLHALDKAHLSTLGIAMMLAVTVPGLVPSAEAVVCFANPAIVTVAALFVVGDGFMRTGAAALVSEHLLERTGGREGIVVLLVMALAAGLSAFLNNTLVVIAFLPVITSICRGSDLKPSRLLLPLSFASVLGGLGSLVGSSTNLLVSGALRDAGHPGLRMFEQTPAGLCVMLVGLAYLGLLGRHLLPRTQSLASQVGLAQSREYVTEITLGADSPLLGRDLADVRLETAEGKTRPLLLVRRGTVRFPPFAGVQLQPGDVLVVTGGLHDLADLGRLGATGLHAGDRFDPATMSFFEVAVTPASPLVGRRVADVGWKERFGAAVVAIQRGGVHRRERLSESRLRSGDVLLVFADEASRDRLRQSSEVHVLEGVTDVVYHRDKAPRAFLVVAGVLALFVSGALPPEVGALAGALGMVLTRCLSPLQALRSVDWSIVLFLGGLLALGRALQHTEATGVLAGLLTEATGGMGPVALVFVTAIVCGLMSECLSNNAVAVIMTPVALTAAVRTGIDPRPLVLAVLVGANACFANPLGYKVHLLVLGPGGYRFRDFCKVGAPLNLITTSVGALAIVWFWRVG